MMNPVISRQIEKRALTLAHSLSLLWIFFSIGAWRASKIAAVTNGSATEPLILFGGVFAVWFCSYLSCIAVGLYFEFKSIKQDLVKYPTLGE